MIYKLNAPKIYEREFLSVIRIKLTVPAALIEQLAHISPAAWFHINLAGFYDFGEKQFEIDMEKIANCLSRNFHHKYIHDEIDLGPSVITGRGIDAELYERYIPAKKNRAKSKQIQGILAEILA